MTAAVVVAASKPRNLVGTGVAARIAGVTQETLRRWHRNPDYRGPRPFQHSGRLQWDADEIRAYIEESRPH
ncbi:hypothetical protein R2362_20090 [Mycobacteroides chelonae]|nr:hypothetical protein [Mycobacteroides chelonae]